MPKARPIVSLPAMQHDAEQLIQALSLAPHPEGGWYRETWRADAAPGERAMGTAIYFLLEAGQQSAWHVVDADELWLWHAGSPLRLRIVEGDDAREIALGADVLAGQHPQARVPKHAWQATIADDGWALVSCVVAPGFEFAGFRMAGAAERERLEMLY
ncbi:MAG: cupin domain-containing protein [Terricaulis sp.]|nr:cupin domain-containing protein [Terricaulis sp.]